MPIYEYECGKCGTFEVSQRITESALRRCPKCKGKVSKLISQTSFQLKGSGWYVTDYSSKDVKDAGTKKTAAKEDKKSDSPAAETESGDSKSSADSKPSSSGSGKTEATAA